jgi:hypothetical protein
MSAPQSLTAHNEERWHQPVQSDPAAAAAEKFTPVRASDLIRRFPNMRPPVIEDLLREGEAMNMVAPPKVGKTWLVHLLAAAVATGRPWLGLVTHRGRVLIVDAELHNETLADRMLRIQRVCGLADAEMDEIDVWSVRGKRLTIDDLRNLLKSVSPGTYRLIIVDALYRFLPLDGEENSNETMTTVYNAVDALAAQLRSAIALVHHSTKGAQGARAVTDVGAGGGAQSRAADAHLILREHEEEGAIVVQAAVRSWKPLAPFVIRWNDPGWVRDYDLDPSRVKQPQRSRKAAKPPAEEPDKPGRTWTVQEFADEFVGPTPVIAEEIIERATKVGHGRGQAKSFLKRAEESGWVHRRICRTTGRHRFSTEPESATLTEALGEVGGHPHPQPPVLQAQGGCGGERATPLPPSSKKKRAKRRRGGTRP